MNKYYKQPRQQIIGFYCFISDKPLKSAGKLKIKRNRINDLQEYFMSLFMPGMTHESGPGRSKFI